MNMMKCLLAIILGIAMYGNPVASQNCYSCTYSTSLSGPTDYCTDASFDLSDSSTVVETPCSGQCASIVTEISGVSSVTRSCGSAVVCGQPDIPGTTVTCCDGNLCNGPSGGGGGDAAGAAGVCSEPLGMECGTILDSQITASTFWDSSVSPAHGRFNGDPSWSSRTLDVHQWIQVDFGYIRNVSGIILQGRRTDADQWVTKYQVTTSIDGYTWTFVKDNQQNDTIFDGNTANEDRNTSVTSMFNLPVLAAFVRIHPTEWYGHISLRFEILGCDEPRVELIPVADVGRREGLQCYSCVDTTGYGCDNDNFNKSQASMVTCAGSCVKEWGMALGIAYSSRGCATDDQGNETVCTENSCEAKSGFGISFEDCTFCCDGELCNGAGSAGGGGKDAGGVAGDGNQCYFCYDVGYGCDDDNFDQANAPMVTCTGSCTKEWGMALGIAYSSRGCATDDQGNETVCTENSCEAKSGFEDCTFCCDGELCNGAGSAGGGGRDAGGVAGDGNQCYFCYDVGYGCDDDNFDKANAPMVTCTGSCTKEWGMALGIESSSRGCATNDKGVETVCTENSCDSFGEACKFCCDGELCNGAGLIAINTAVILSATAVSALLVMIF